MMKKTIEAMSDNEVLALVNSLPTEKAQVANLTKNQADSLYYRLSIAIELLIEKEMIGNRTKQKAV